MIVWEDVDLGLVKVFEGVFDVEIVREWLKVCIFEGYLRVRGYVFLSFGIRSFFFTFGLDFCFRVWVFY